MIRRYGQQKDNTHLGGENMSKVLLDNVVLVKSDFIMDQ